MVLKSVSLFSNFLKLFLLVIKQDAVKTLYIPQYKSLSIKEICKYLDGKEETFYYYPIQQELAKLPKDWFVNIAYSVLGEEFSDWVKHHIDQRN